MFSIASIIELFVGTADDNALEVELSDYLMKTIGCNESFVKAEDLRKWIVSQYGDVDFCGKAGAVLRTLRPNDYFRFVEYVKNK